MNELRVQFLGSGDAFGSGGRLQTCILVDAPALRFLIDCGASSMIGLRRWHINLNSVELILLTHLHGDHLGGLPFFLLDAQLVSKRTKLLTVAGPSGAENRIREAQEVFFPGSSRTPKKFPINYLEWTNGTPTKIGNLVVIPYQVEHDSGAPSFALRVEQQGKVLSYSGDTEWTDALIPAAQGADLFICEAYYFEKRMRFHLDYQTLKAHRTELACKRLILTHLNADLLRQLESVDLEYAEDGKRIVL